MSESSDRLERQLLSCCYLDGATIDTATAAGISAACFNNALLATHWRALTRLRLEGKPTGSDAVYADAVETGTLANLGGLQGIMDASGGEPTTLHASGYVTSLLNMHAQRESWRLFTAAAESIKNGTANLEKLKETAEAVAGICSGQQSVRRALSDIADDAIKDAEETIAGTKPTRSLIYTGLPNFDRYATPVESHEYVVVGARTSHGKSSFLTQLIGHNLALGKRIAVFTLETSDKAVLKQIVGQRAGVNLRNLAGELPSKQQEYLEKLRYAKDTKNLIIFDRDIRLDALESRCRLLAASFKPHMVVVDYLGLVIVPGTSQYERITAISKAMIPMRKTLGCPIFLGCQLGRGVEKEDREPQRTDFKDSGSIEEDASRLIVIWRKPNQALDLDYYETVLLQLKLRDGPTASVACRFHSPTTRFLEEAA